MTRKSLFRVIFRLYSLSLLCLFAVFSSHARKDDSKQGGIIREAGKANIEPSIVIDGEGEELSNISIVDIKKEEAYLHNAASMGLLAEVKRALNRGAFINSVDQKYGNTALIWAASNGKFEIVEYLLRKGADPFIINYKGDKTALLSAVHIGHTKIVKALIDQGASVSHQNTRGDTPILVAAYQGSIEMVRLLHSHGASIHHAASTNGYQAIHLAAFKGHQHIVQYFIANNADIEAADHSGKTSLMLAAMEGHESIVRDFIKAGADINALEMQGNTALMLSAQRNHSATTRLLMEQPDCLIHVYNKLNDHVMYMAVRNGNTAMVEDIVLFGLEHVTKPIFLNSVISMAEAHNYPQIGDFLRQFLSVSYKD